MGIQRSFTQGLGVVVVGAVVAVAGAAPAHAFQALTPGVQVNNDPAAGINPALSVSGDDPTNADVVGGALVAGKVAVPWAIFRQTEAGGAKDQVFSRSFAGGVWTTRGSGTVGGSSSAAPTVLGVAQLRPGSGRRGAGDRLRGRRADGAVGDLVRGHDRRGLR